ncbi:MAG TPA: OmpA family protein [Terracidiphilus sp.]|nr:OmpA family protein [Terracidiphilus sp.]
MKHTLLFVIGSVLGLSVFVQASPQDSIALMPVGPTSASTETSRTVEAVNYQHRGGASEIDLAGTALLPSVQGKAKVRSKRGTMEVEAEFENLQSPTTFGTEYLTYVMWAISPDGRAVNLGEVLIGGNAQSKLTATTNLQAFALIVTAEPYFAVRQPSNVVVLENVVRPDTKGTPEAMNAKYELMERGGYIPTGYKFDPVVLDAKLPLEFLEARNAVRIAQSEGAEKYSGDSYKRAVELMDSADLYATAGRSDKKQLIAKSRETVQTAEDAREIAVKRMDEDRAAQERQDAADAQAQSRDEAERATRQKERAQAEAAAAQDAATKAHTDMVNSQEASAVAIDAAQADADQSRLAAQIAKQGEDKADSEKVSMRAQLEARLNEILETRDSARGLIVSMSDVLFDTGHYTLKSGAREKLAKIAGILIAYPGLNIAVGGYTDNVGGDEMNQKLSENRAGAVREFLVQQGVVAGSVSATGFGSSSPVASNENSTGRQENRRVELVVSGEAIGSPVNTTIGSIR